MTDFFRNSLALLGASSLAISIPLFSTLADGVSFFIAHNAQAVDVVLLSLLIYSLPVVIISLLAGLASSAGVRVSNTVFSTGFFLLATIWALGAFRGLPTTAALFVSALVAVALTIAYRRVELFTSLLRTLGWISPLILLAFLFLSPVKAMVVEKALGAAANSELQTKAKTHPVVFVVLDELSLSSILDQDGEIDGARLPNFKRLANLSTWYRNTTTVSSLTDTAVPAILSGLYPKSDKAPIRSDYPLNVFTALANSHQMFVTETVTRLCATAVCKPRLEADDIATHTSRVDPVGDLEGQADRAAILSDIKLVFLHLVTPAAWAEKHLPSLGDSWSGFGAKKPAEGVANKDLALWTVQDMSSNSGAAFRTFSRKLSGVSEKQLHYFHLSLPHHPWTLLPDGSRYNGITDLGRAAGGYVWNDNAYHVRQAQMRYLLQLQYVDKLMGVMLDNLQSSAQFDDTLLVVMSDHGLAFEAGSAVRLPDESTLNDIARIPLFIKYPKQKMQRVDDRPAQTIDVLPTLADVLQLGLAAHFDGRTLTTSEDSAPQRKVLEAEFSPTEFEELLQPVQSMRGPMLDSDKVKLSEMPGERDEILLGTSINDWKVAGQTSFHVVLDNAHWYENVKLNSGFLPVRLSASIMNSSTNTELLVAMNNKVAGAGVSHDNGKRLSLMLAPDLFQQGLNRLAFFTVVEDSWQSVAVRAHSSQASLSFLSDSEAIETVTIGEQSWVVRDSTALRGWAKAKSKDELRISGWAYNFESKRAATKVLLLRDDHITNAKPRTFALFPFGGEYEDFESGSEPGFSFEVNDSTTQYRVVALFDNGALLDLPVEIEITDSHSE